MSQFNYKEILEEQLPYGIYKNNSIEANAVGNTLNKLQDDIDITEKEVNPKTAQSKGLEQWEQFFKLPSNVEEDIQIRRARVISELIQFMADENVIRKDEMENIVSLYADNCYINERFSERIFDVILDISKTESNIQEITKTIKKIKPAWLDYTLSLIFKPANNKIYIASCLTTGEEITVYPYIAKDIESRGKIYVSVGNNTGLENISVYPRKEVI